MFKNLIIETLKELKELKESREKSPMVGKICMIRAHSSGVHFGKLVSKKKQNVILENARRVHYWAAACSLSQLAMEGDKKIDECRISMPVDLIEIEMVGKSMRQAIERYGIEL